MRARIALGALGVAAAAYGGWRLLSRQHGSDLVDAVTWLAGGVLLHDALLAPLVVLLGLGAVRVLPLAARAPAAVGLVVLGSVTLMGVPVLGRFGARSDNPTLLDRDYTAGWLVLAAIIVAAVVAASWWRARRGGVPSGRRWHGPGPGGR